MVLVYLDGKCFHIYTATFVYLLVRIYLVRHMLSYIYCYFYLLIGTRILGTANAFIYILLLLFTDWRAYTRYGKCFHKYTATFVYLVARVYLVRQMLSYIYCYFCLLIGTHILGTANAFIYILLLLFTDSRAYTWYGKCFHIYTATIVYVLVRIYLVRQMLSYIYCNFCLLIGTRILGAGNAFIYILLLLFTAWCAYTWYGKCFHIYTATFVYRLVRVYLVRHMLSYIYCYFYLLIGTRVLGTAKCFHIYTATSVYWLERVYWVRQMLSYIYCYFCLLSGTRILGTTLCFHVYTATFVYCLVRVYMVRQMLSYIYCHFCLLIGARILSTEKCFQIYTASFVYWLVRVYLVRQMFPNIYCFFCLLIGTRILGTANAFIYILLLLFTDWYAYTWYGKMLSYIYCYFCLLIGAGILDTANAFIYILLLLFTWCYAYTWYGKCFHIYTATFVYWFARLYLVRQMLSYIYCYFCLLIGTHILGTANAFIYILQLLFTDWYAYTWYGKCFHIYTATFVYWLVRVYLVQKNVSKYILLLLFTDWYAYTWYGKCFHIYTATFVNWLVRVYLVRQLLSYIYCYFCLLIGTHILDTANAFIYILLLVFTYWYAYIWHGKCFHIYILLLLFT